MKSTMCGILFGAMLLMPVSSFAQISPLSPQLSLPDNLHDIRTLQAGSGKGMDTKYNPWVSINNLAAENSRIGPQGLTETMSELTIKGHRSIQTLFYFPQTMPTYDVPVIILSAQYGTSPIAYSNFIKHLTSFGYLVIAPIHSDATSSQAEPRTDEDIQERITDVHDIVRSLPFLKQLTKMNISQNYSFIGFKEGALDCLLNSGVSPTSAKINSWPGQPQSLLLISPVDGDIPASYARMTTPVMIASTMDGLNIQNGLLAQMPEDGIRLMAAFTDFDDPLMSVTQQENPQAFMWESLATTWERATLGADMKNMDILKTDVYSQMSGEKIKTHLEIAKPPAQ